jgi:hypothetical protein
MATYQQVILAMARAGVSLAHQSGRTLEDVNDDLMDAMVARQRAEAEEYFRELEIAQWLEDQVFEGVE